MLDIFTDTIDSTLDVAGALLVGEVPERRTIAKLLNSGLAVAEIASLFGVAESAIEKLLDD